MTGERAPAPAGAGDADLDLLAGLTVLELGDGIAGSFAAHALRSLGARVTKVVSHPRRHERHRPQMVCADGRPRSLLTLLLDEGKELVEAVDPPGRIGAHDLVVCDLFDGAPPLVGGPERGAYRARVDALAAPAWVTVSPYGLDGPLADVAGSNLTVMASVGFLGGLKPGRPGLAKTPGQQGLLSAGAAAAAAGLHARFLHLASGEPIHLDLSAQEAIISGCSLLDLAHGVHDLTGAPGSGTYSAPSGIYPCADGELRLSVLEDHQWQSLRAVLGAPAWTDGLDTAAARVEARGRIDAEMAAWCRPQAKDDCAARLQARGVPAAPITTPRDLVTSEQFRHRRFLQDATLGGVEVRRPRAPYLVTRGGAAPAVAGPAPVPALPRVAEFGHVLAVPYTATILGICGAEVTKVEDVARLDMYRRNGPYIGGRAGVDHGSYFVIANHAKRAVALDGEPEEVARAARDQARAADVVLENLGMRRAERLGLLAPPDRAGPQLRLHCSAFGLSGPMAAWRGYAHVIQAFSGLVALSDPGPTGAVQEVPAWADLSSAWTMATVSLAWALAGERPDVDVDLSMAEVAAGRLAEHFVLPADDGDAWRFPAERDHHLDCAPDAPHGVFPLGDDRLALSVETDAEWAALVAALGAEAPPRWAAADVRWAERADVDAAVASWLAGRTAADVLARLQGAGVRAGPAVELRVALRSDHLVARHFVVTASHPGLTGVAVASLPWRLAGGEAWPVGAVPVLPEPDPA